MIKGFDCSVRFCHLLFYTKKEQLSSFQEKHFDFKVC